MKSTGTRFGLTDEQWALAKGEVREAILDAAYDRRMTSYGEVADGVSVVELDPPAGFEHYFAGLADILSSPRPPMPGNWRHLPTGTVSRLISPLYRGWRPPTGSRSHDLAGLRELCGLARVSMGGTREPGRRVTTFPGAVVTSSPAGGSFSGERPAEARCGRSLEIREPARRKYQALCSGRFPPRAAGLCGILPWPPWPRHPRGEVCGSIRPAPIGRSP